MGFLHNRYCFYPLKIPKTYLAADFLDVATDRMIKSMKKEAGIQKEYSVEQLISCSGLKNGCEGATVETAWNKMNLEKNENRG